MLRTLTAMSIFAFAATTAAAEPVKFTLEGIEARGGTLYVGVQTEDQFEKDDGVAGQIIENPKAGDMSFEFDLEGGEYSISVWHDLDDDREFDLDDNYRPTDGWALVNGAGLQGRPVFEDVKFAVSSGGITLSESMIYPAG